MGKARTILIVLCWAAYGFFLYLGYSEIFDLPQIELPIEYAYLPVALRTFESEIMLLISGLVLGLISYAILFPSNPTDLTGVVNDEIPPKLEKLIDSMTKGLEKYEPKPFPEITRGKAAEVGTAIIDGITKHSRRIPPSPAALEKKASEYTVDEAWAILRTDYWDTKRRTLKRFNPEIYEQIMYWENHLDEYFVYMNMKLLFNLPYLEHDFWVRRKL